METGRGATNICPRGILPVSLPGSTQAEHTPMHTAPLRAARLSFITLADESSGRLKINVTERRRSDSQPASQPASSCQSGKGGRFKRSQSWIVKSRDIRNICNSALLSFCHDRICVREASTSGQITSKKLSYLRPRPISSQLACSEVLFSSHLFI